MPTNTSKFNLVKPLKSEKYNVDVFNGNADTIDSQIYSKTEVDTALNGKVDKVTGKGLSTEDYTTAEKAKVANIPLDTNAQLAQIAINVKNFGALGDNVDDTLSIMLAVDEALLKKAKLYFPAGIYVIKKSTIEANRPTDIIKASGDYIKTASMTGYNATVVIDGHIGFDTSSVVDFECTNLDFELRNGQLTNYDNPVNYVFRNISPTNTSKRLYRDLTFNGIVNVTDGTQRYRGAIAEHCVDGGYFNNLIFKNISICMYLEGQNFTVDSFHAFNFQTGVWASDTNSKNFNIMNITGKNTVAQSQTWLNKTHPTKPLDLNGANLFLGGQDNYSLINLLSVNPIERCIYSQGGNVTARNLKSFNGSGFKFVGRGYTDIVKNIDIDGCELIIDRDPNNLVSLHQIYWVDGVNIRNSRLTDMTANGRNKAMGLITLSLYVKNIVLDNISCNAGLGNSLVYLELRTEPSLTAQEYLVLENLTLKNSHIYKNNRSLGSLFMQRDVEASADAKLNYCGRNINIKNCHVEYGTTTDDFIYDFNYIDGFHGENNTSNKRVVSAYGIAPYNTAIKNNVVLNEVLYYTNETTSIDMLKNVRLTKGSKLTFKRTNAFKADMFVEVTKGTTFDDTNLLALYDNSKVRYVIYSAEYIDLTNMFDNYMIEIQSDNGYYLGQVIGATLTNLIRTPPFTITVASINRLTMRGDQYNGNATIEIVKV